jgi:hypothetical protein
MNILKGSERVTMNVRIDTNQCLSQAEKWLAEAKSLDDLKNIHDIAIAAEAYAKAHRLGIDAENHDKEVKFLAACPVILDRYRRESGVKTDDSGLF